jgi:hypothetical protein
MAADEPKPYHMGESHFPDAAGPRLGGVPGNSPAGDAASVGSTRLERPASAEAIGAATAPPPPDEVGLQTVDRLGAHLARALQEGGYHPVVLFGTNFSGKTSLLLSALATLMSEPRLGTGIVLCDPILGSESGVGRQLHTEARKLFEVMTQAFLEGEKIPATRLPLPFFVPVEIRPAGKPAMRFAFLESNGEWYRPLREKGKSLVGSERLYPQLRTEIEDFIASFQGGMSFIYLIPYTQSYVHSERDELKDADEVESASLAIAGVLRAYDRIRATHRVSDRHLMLVTKWDAHSARASDRADGLQEDRIDLDEFAGRRYAKAIAAFQSLAVAPEQRSLNAYCAGLMNERGLLQLRQGDDVRDVVMTYPIRLWNWLYRNALIAKELPIEPLFPEAPKPPWLVLAWRGLLDFMSGR